MNKYNDLIVKFNEISNKKWIMGVNNLTNSVGLTFEKYLNKKPDSMFFPDYHGIEIKCTQRFSRYPITLFSSAFDGPSLYEMNRLLDRYGKKDIIYKNRKLLIADLSCTKKTLVNGKYYFKLSISNVEQKLIIEIFDINNELIENKTFITFETLKNKLEIKLKNMAMIWASKKTINSATYFRYYKMIIYKLTSFENFITLLKRDIILVQICGRVSRSGTESGRQRNKNLVFKIDKDNLEKLFSIQKICDNDLNKNFNIV